MRQTVYTLAAATSTEIAATDRARGYLAIQNIGTEDATLGFGAAAVAGSGWLLSADGGGFTWSEQSKFAPVGSVTAISTLGTTIVVMEG